MGDSSSRDATSLLHAMASGDGAARDQLVALLYDHMRAIAARLVREQPPASSVNATALVNEACMKLIGSEASWKDQQHFLAAAAVAMRHVIIDHARSRKRAKRNGTLVDIHLDQVVDAFQDRAVDLEALDVALRRMADFNPDMARAVELRFFGGASVEDAAAALGLSRRTFERRWEAARAWLWKELA